MLAGLLGAALSGLGVRPLRGQTGDVQRLELAVGRSYPVTAPATISRVSVALPEVADVAVISEREVVINAKAVGETDVLLWLASGTRTHYRVAVSSPTDRMQVALYVKFAELRRDRVRELGISALYRGNDTRVGTGDFRSDNVFDENGNFIIPGAARFLTVLSTFDTDRLLAFINAEEVSGNGRILAEPNVMAGNKEQATFLAGGEIPIPVATGAGSSDDGAIRVTIQYKEFGVRLNFVAEILNDSLVKLNVTPEVSSLDFGNGVLLSGFRIPALRTRRVQSTVDVKRNQSIIISGLFNADAEEVRTGIPFLKDIPILGLLFRSTRWQRNESELLIVVTPVVVDPMRPRPQDVLRFRPDTTLPAREAIEKRLPGSGRTPPP
ncbi:MAG: type II and III secretion system protein family protein [Gemmatimonadaceae bacterium]